MPAMGSMPVISMADDGSVVCEADPAELMLADTT